jgi:hypothetical protein
MTVWFFLLYGFFTVWFFFFQNSCLFQSCQNSCQNSGVLFFIPVGLVFHSSSWVLPLPPLPVFVFGYWIVVAAAHHTRIVVHVASYLGVLLVLSCPSCLVLSYLFSCNASSASSLSFVSLSLLSLDKVADGLKDKDKDKDEHEGTQRRRRRRRQKPK